MEEKYLTQNNHIEVRLTPNKGYGVFATKNINEGDLIEKCYCIKAADTFPELPSPLMDYAYNYPQGIETDKTIQVIALGYGSIYNHDDTPNAKWKDAEEEMYFDFIAIKDIKAGEEICTYYGDSYWPQSNERHNEVVQKV